MNLARFDPKTVLSIAVVAMLVQQAFSYVCQIVMPILADRIADDFNIANFIEYSAKYGISFYDNKKYTLLLSPMNGFFTTKTYENKLARIALVEPKDKMKVVPSLLSNLLKDYLVKHES